MEEFNITLKLNNEVVYRYLVDAEDEESAIALAPYIENVEYDEILSFKHGK